MIEPANNKHISVMLNEVLTAANTALLPSQKNFNYWDATLGGGGHSFAFLEKFAKEALPAHLALTDLDSEAWRHFQTRLQAAAFKVPDQIKLQFVQGNFKDLAESFKTEGRTFDFILADLGLSQNLLENTKLGLSYRTEAPLDMRYVKNLAVTAADLLNGLGRKQLHQMLTNYADIRDASLVEAIIEARPLRTTTDLDKVLLNWLNAERINYLELNKQKRKYEKSVARHLAQVYQALRIAVNLEYDNLREFLIVAPKLLSKSGILAVITFHSGEQRLVKQLSESQNLKLKTIKPSAREVQRNPRARSAQLNLITKS